MKRTKTESTLTADQIPAMADISPEYGQAVDKLRELDAELARVDDEIQREAKELRAEKDRQEAAEALLDGDQPVSEALVANPGQSQRQKLEELHRQRQQLLEARRLQEDRVAGAERSAALQVGDAIRPQWETLLADQARLLAELAAAVEHYGRLQQHMPSGHAEKAGLQTFNLRGPLGRGLDAALRRALEAGLLTPEDLPAGWGR